MGTTRKTELNDELKTVRNRLLDEKNPVFKQHRKHAKAKKKSRIGLFKNCVLLVKIMTTNRRD